MKNQKDLLVGDNLPFIEDLYAEYVKDPNSVDPSWRPLFEEYFGVKPNGHATGRVAPKFEAKSLFSAVVNVQAEGGNAYGFSEAEYAETSTPGTSVKTPERSSKFAARVKALLRAHRLHGHLIADLDPLGRPRRNSPPELEPATYGIAEADLGTPVVCESLFGTRSVTLQEVIDRARELYCNHIGIEFQNIPETEPRKWLRKQVENNEYAPIEGSDEKKFIYDRLVAADAFEHFLHTKYVGVKRFGITGGDALIPMLDALLNEGGQLGLRECVIGMAHRGRLNVLHNIMGKSSEAMLSEFEKAPNPEDSLGSSDVKYHMGYSSDYKTRGGKEIHLSMSFNPSHLEFVNPVVMGRTRAKQDRCAKDDCRTKLLPLLLHGDAAFAGQGIVVESLNLADLEATDVGGTIHIVINNQIGFTAKPEESRSTTYCTDIAKTLEVPIFHVNSDDPEACVRVAKLAMRYRQRFQQDVVIDFICYRRYGHNEGDEPRFTNPLMYKAIDATEPVRLQYAKQLADSGVMTQDEIDAVWTERLDDYGSVFEKIRKAPNRETVSTLEGVWDNYRGGDVGAAITETHVPMETLTALGKKIATLPESVTPHRTIKRTFANRAKMVAGDVPLDWGAAESLAFATLAAEGTPIRLHGQDSLRGTFGHRHAAVFDSTTGDKYWPIREVAKEGTAFEVFNSILNEAGVLGYEYGYSLDYPEALVIWEAQFGDFANGAQVIIDQFITSGEDKWKRLSGLVMLLPHGYEGQGPEHSSARLERFLQMSAEDNMFVCNLTLPSQHFHVLRRQVRNPVRKPLVMMTPKSLLRLRDATSTLEELASGEFQRIIGDVRGVKEDDVKRVLLCSGKVYYDLANFAAENDRNDVAIVRIEQLFPLDQSELKSVVGKFKNADDIKWVQEEPKNMGAWSYMLPHLLDTFDQKPKFVGREASASPATGLKESHEIEQSMFINEAFADS